MIPSAKQNRREQDLSTHVGQDIDQRRQLGRRRTDPMTAPRYVLYLTNGLAHAFDAEQRRSVQLAN
jgi:hypothetical protein